MSLFQSALILLLAVSFSSSSTITVTRGVTLNPPPGYLAYNLDPTLNSSQIGPIYDPNFIPGFQVGLTNTSIFWETGIGYIRFGYAIGPWQYLQVQLPHLAVGPQCCNFHEIPRTQQFRRPEWGDYYEVTAGFLPPAVNIANYTTNFAAPAYVGLRTDWDWVVNFSMNWTPPTIIREENRWSAIGLTATEYVPNAPKKLIYTVVNFWMDSNSTKMLNLNPNDPDSYSAASSNVVVYHPIQLSTPGNLTLSVDLSPYLSNTLEVLGLQTNETSPPVISYIYLNVEGYNFSWNCTLYSMFIMSNQSRGTQSQNLFPIEYVLLPSAVLMISIVLVFVRKRR